MDGSDTTGPATGPPSADSVDAIVAAIDAQLRAAGSPDRAEHERAYLKSTLTHYGASVPATRQAVRDHLPRRPAPSHGLVVAVAEGLWAAPIHERRAAAGFALEAHVGLLGPADAALVERLLREARTWALVDVLAPCVMGPLVVAHPELGAVLDRWATDPDLWIRRAALLTLLKPLRAGGGDWERFTRYADALLEDREFFVRKAIGWVLRDTGRKRPDLVFDWFLPRAARASGVTRREVVKVLSPGQRAQVERAAG